MYTANITHKYDDDYNLSLGNKHGTIPFIFIRRKTWTNERIIQWTILWTEISPSANTHISVNRFVFYDLYLLNILFEQK